jgi:hypothetical protein
MTGLLPSGLALAWVLCALAVYAWQYLDYFNTVLRILGVG